MKPWVKYLIIFVGVVLSATGLFLLLRRSRKGQGATKQEAITSVFSETEYANMIPLLIAQSAHETNSWKSNIYLENHNLFGMKNPSKRQTTSLGEKRGHAYYADDVESALDMYYYLRTFKYPTDFGTLADYVNTLKSHAYFEDTIEHYVNGMQRNPVT